MLHGSIRESSRLMGGFYDPMSEFSRLMGEFYDPMGEFSSSMGESKIATKKVSGTLQKIGWYLTPF
jgi:hypothetical protein